jgi:hypothetical protein
MKSIIITTCMCILSGLTVRFALQLCSQIWVRSFQNTVSYLLLPVIAYVITNIISDNIALSLGMIGALSIVRFRHPVKSSLELVIFFALITIGIAYSVNYKWALLLNFVVIIVSLASKYLDYYYKKNNKYLFSLSYSEGQHLNFLEIISNNKIEKLEDNRHLVQSYNDIENNSFSYKISSDNKNELLELKKDLESNKSVKSLELTYGS